VYGLVAVPHPTGGNDEYLIEKPTGLFDAVRRALVIDEERSGRRPDVIRVGRMTPWVGPRSIWKSMRPKG